jgi:hypothetical protein
MMSDAIDLLAKERILLTSESEVKANAPSVKVQGDAIAMEYHQQATPIGQHQRTGGTEDPEGDPNVTLKFTHLATDNADPIADTHYRAVAGSFTYEGDTDGDGQIRIHVPDDIHTVDVSLFAHQKYPDIYPNPMPLSWNISLASEMPAVEDLHGAAIRLKNLGYDFDVPEDEHDASFVEALTAFQFDHKIAETGENDEDTQRKLRDVYGS